jgi:hypothetical protein
MLALVGAVALALTAPLVIAQSGQEKKDQEKIDQGKMGKEVPPQDKGGKDQPKFEELQNLPRVKAAAPIRSGYTRPGFPSDPEKDGKVIPLASDPGYKGRLLGGTVYFAVYERQESPGVVGDTFGTGVPNFDELFREGHSAGGQYSPALDTTAKYLYLYQIVNDRGLDPPKEGIVFAGFNDPKTEDIITSTVKLLVDPQEITSWGHFKSLGFSAKVPEKTLKGAVVQTADGNSERILQVAFSSFPSILAALPVHRYEVFSPPMSLHELKNDFAIAKADLNLKATKAHTELVALVANNDALPWQKNMIKDLGREPTYVNIVLPETSRYGNLTAAPSDDDVRRRPIEQRMPKAYLKADWRGNQIVKLGQHSVAFGFTSNLPPVDDLVRVVSEKKKEGEKGGEQNVGFGFANEEQAGGDEGQIRTVAIDGNGPGVGAGQVAGPGTVPTPAGGRGGAAAPGGFGNWMGGGGMPGGGFGGGPGGGLGGGGIGVPAGATGGGSGGGIGTTGQNQNPPTQAQSQTPTQQQSQTPSQQQSIGNISVTTGNVFQQQQQQQQQQQSQSVTTCCNNMGQVVPEPAAIALGLLGLPALFMVLRRRKATQSIDSSAPSAS